MLAYLRRAGGVLRLKLDGVRMRAAASADGVAGAVDLVVVPCRLLLSVVGPLELLLQRQVLRVQHLELALDLKL